MLDKFNIQSSTGISESDGIYFVTFADSKREVTVDELNSAKRLKLAEELDLHCRAKISTLFGSPESTERLLIKQQNAQMMWSKLLMLSGQRQLTVEEQSMFDALTATASKIEAWRLYEKQRQVELLSADPDTFDIAYGWPA